MSELIRGVTPTFTFIAPEGLDMTLPSQIWVTFSTPDEREILTKKGDELDVEEDRINVFLSQDETLKFTRTILVQINWMYEDNTREASEKITINTESNLKNEVLNAEGL